MLDVERKELRKALEDLSVHFARIEIEREGIKDAIAALNEKYEVPKAMLSKLANMLHLQNASEVLSKNQELEELYEEITNGE